MKFRMLLVFAVFPLFLALAGPAAASTWGLLASVRWGTGGPAASVVSADFNLDGMPDVAVAVHMKNGRILFFQGDGKGRFSKTVQTNLTGDPVYLVTGDYNGDGKMDIAAALFDNDALKIPGKVVILLGNGDGTFSISQTFTVGIRPISIAQADLDGDGDADLAVANFDGGTVSILLGDGTGGFVAGGTFPAGAHPRQVVAADLNGDGILDLAVTHLDFPNATILLGDGTGSFAAPAADTTIAFQTGAMPWGIAASDLDGDGRVDLAVTEAGKAQVDVMFQNTTTAGKFNAPLKMRGNNAPDFVLANDINQDGKTDLLVADGWSNTLSVFTGKGGRQFNTDRAFLASTYPLSITVTDLNRDGDPDIVVADVNISSISVFLASVTGKGTWGFGFPVPAFAGGSWPKGLTAAAFTNSGTATADFNRDGKPDKADISGNTVIVSINNGDGTYTPKDPITVGSSPSAIIAADLNRDGKPDIAVANGGDGTVSVLLGNGDGTFQARKDFAVGLNPTSMAVGDFGAPNGFLDLAVSASPVFPPDPATDAVSVLFGQDQVKVTIAVSTTTLGVAQGTVSFVMDRADPSKDVVLPPGTYFFENGSTLTLRATPNSGLTFSSWSGTFASTENPHGFTVLPNMTIKANFR